MKNINKINQNCHPELVSGSMVGSAWRVGKNLDGSCQRANGFRTKSGMTGECGRSMVEMLGVLAIIGVLSVGGIAGYTTAMNKHRANEILNAASVRAMVVSTQIQNGSTSPTLAEFTDNKVGSATFGTDVKNTAGTGAWVKGTDNRFSLTLSGVDTKVCDQMKNIAGENSIIKAWGDNCASLTYNNDLTASGTESTATCFPTCELGKICSSGNCIDGPTAESCGTNEQGDLLDGSGHIGMGIKVDNPLCCEAYVGPAANIFTYDGDTYCCDDMHINLKDVCCFGYLQSKGEYEEGAAIFEDGQGHYLCCANPNASDECCQYFMQDPTMKKGDC